MIERGFILRGCAIAGVIGALAGNGNSKQVVGSYREVANDAMYCSYDLENAEIADELPQTCANVYLPKTNPDNLDTVTSPMASAREAEAIADSEYHSAKVAKATEIYTDMIIDEIIWGGFILLTQLRIGGVRVADPYGKSR